MIEYGRQGAHERMQDAEREWKDRERSSLMANSQLIDDDENGNEEEPPPLSGRKTKTGREKEGCKAKSAYPFNDICHKQ